MHGVATWLFVNSYFENIMITISYINNSWNKHAPMCNINNYYQRT